jgi:peptidoglycan/xylan/chitin deacetylase (PgdA/CDA1 family)
MERESARQFARQTAWAGGGEVPLQLVDDLIRQFGPERFSRLLQSYASLRVMNATELRDLVRDGFDVAVHGYYHLGLGTLSPELVEREICEARSTLAALLPDTVIDVFCLPYGSSSPMALARVRDAGFRACLTTERGRVADPWLLPRFDAVQSTAALLRDLARSR